MMRAIPPIPNSQNIDSAGERSSPMSFSVGSSTAASALNEAYRGLSGSMKKASGGGNAQNLGVLNQKSVHVQLNNNIVNQAREMHADMVGKLINSVA